MTVKEKLMKERPEIDEDYFKMHCPDEEGMIPSKKCKCNPKSRVETVTEAPPRLCDDCWNQPYGFSLWQILLVVACVVTLIVSLICIDLHIFAAGPSKDTIDISVADTLEPVKESVPEEPVETTTEETIVEETTSEPVVETATEPVVETATEPEVIVPAVDISKGKRMTLVATAYCGENYPHICNDGDSSRTATGTKPMAGRTIAVDPRMIPYGSKVIINGVTYIAEDCGGAIKSNRIDIFFDTHQEALQWGRRTVEAIVITE